MDGSHASHCEEIIAGCTPRALQNKRPGIPKASLFTCDAQELIAVNSCTGCNEGAVVAVFYITNTPLLLKSRLFPATWKQNLKWMQKSRWPMGPPQKSAQLIKLCLILFGNYMDDKKKDIF